MALTPSAMAQSAAQPKEISAVYGCKSVPNALERLECYDNAVGRLQAAEDSGEVVTVSKTEVEKVEQDAFGYNVPFLPVLGKLFKKDKSESKEVAIVGSSPSPVTENGQTRTKTAKAEKQPALGGDDLKSVSLEIQKTTEFGRNKTRFFFKNGQVWEQTRSESIRIPKVRGGVPNTAVISKAAMGSFLLRVNDKGRATRVRRVR